MSYAIDTLRAAQTRALAGRPAIGGFPYLAETLRRAGVTLNTWHLPSCQSLYLTDAGPVMQQGEPLVSGLVDVPSFDQAALIEALRTDQAGQSSFPAFLDAAWKAGVVRYDVDLLDRSVTYHGCRGETYQERYAEVSLD